MPICCTRALTDDQDLSWQRDARIRRGMQGWMEQPHGDTKVPPAGDVSLAVLIRTIVR